MPLIQGTTSIPGGAVNDNVLAASQFEFLPYDASLEFGLNGDAGGGDLRVDVYAGTRILLENAPMSTTARIPVYPDDYNLDDVGAAGERIKIRVRNVSAAARQLFHSVRITPL